jgi:hypothetical protein
MFKSLYVLSSVLLTSIVISSMPHSTSYAQVGISGFRSISRGSYGSIRGSLRLPQQIKVSRYGYASFYFNLGNNCGAGISYGKKGGTDGQWYTFMNCGTNRGDSGTPIVLQPINTIELSYDGVRQVTLFVNGRRVQSAMTRLSPSSVSMVHAYYDEPRGTEKTYYDSAAFEGVECNYSRSFCNFSSPESFGTARRLFYRSTPTTLNTYMR